MTNKKIKKEIEQILLDTKFDGHSDSFGEAEDKLFELVRKAKVETAEIISGYLTKEANQQTTAKGLPNVIATETFEYIDWIENQIEGIKEDRDAI